MRHANSSIADEVEAAIAAGSTQRCAETARRVTALFLASAGGFNEEQIALFADVFERLINTMELRAIAEVSARIALTELSTQLAPVRQAPVSVIGRLARNDEIAVAGPVLTESSRLGTDDLVEIARMKGEPHCLAIAARWWLKEVVCDTLLARRFPSVSRRLMRNPGARLSPAGFAIVIAQAEHDPELAVETGIRVDLPTELRAQLLQNATDTVRARLLSSAPPHLFEEIRDAISAVANGADREMSRVGDFTAANLLITQLKREGRLTQATLYDFAKKRKYEETVTALAELSQCNVEIVRPLMQSLRSDGILVPCKVAGLDWKTVSAVLESRFSSGAMAASELAELKAQFDGLTPDKAHRMLRFWKVGSAVSPPRPH
jgi:uncharacterized protein (DUF2336 family)